MGLWFFLTRFFCEQWSAWVWDVLAGAAITALYMMVLCVSIWTF